MAHPLQWQQQELSWEMELAVAPRQAAWSADKEAEGHDPLEQWVRPGLASQHGPSQVLLPSWVLLF